MTGSWKQASRIVVIAGLDGVGKTSHSILLRDWLNEKGIPAVYLHHSGATEGPWRRFKRRYHGAAVARLRSAGSDTDVMAPTENGARRRPLVRAFASAIALAGIASGWLRSWYRFLRYRRQVVLSDRWFADDLVKAEWRLGVRLTADPVRLLRTVPAPGMIVVLSAPLELSHSRKKPPVKIDFSDYRRKAEIFEKQIDALRRSGWPITVIECGSDDLSTVQNRVRAAVALHIGQSS